MGRVWVNEAEAAREAVRIAREQTEEVANFLRNQLVRTSPRDSGRLANSWAVDVEVGDGKVTAHVYSNVKPDSTDRYLWELHHAGTGRYGPQHRDIVPVRRKALRWRGGRGVASPNGAGYVFATRSRGIKPNRWIVEAVEATAAAYPGWHIQITTPAGTTPTD